VDLFCPWHHLSCFKFKTKAQRKILAESICGISGRTGTYCEQPRHSQYGLDRFVAAQASSSTGLKATLRPAAGKQAFPRPAAGKQSFYE